MKQLDIVSLRQQLEYIEETGWLRWKRTRKIAGCVTESGYVTVRINGTLELAHRIIWAIQTGEQPPQLIDHDDRNKSNNKWDNLKANTKAGNGLNRNRTSGVYKTPNGNWAAHYHEFYRKVHIGTFPTKEQAEVAASKARAKLLQKEQKEAT